MNYFTRNSSLLFSQLPDLKEALSSFTPSDRMEIIETPAGVPSALYDGVSVHSRRDPVKEARTLIDRKVPAGVTVGVFYGFGLGYLVESFITSFPDRPCVVVEPDIGCFLKALESRDLSAVLSHPRTVFFLASEPTPVIRYLDTLPLAAVQIVKLRSLYDKDRAYYERTDELIQSFLRQRDVNKNTLRRFGRRWVRNLLANAPLLCRTPGVNRAEGLFHGVPALVLAGGPSLDRVLPHLKRLSERMLLVAVDTSLAVIRARGLDPDVTVAADPQYWNTRHLDWVKQTDSLIISEASTHPRAFRLLGDRVMFYSSVFPLGRYLETYTGAKGKLGAGGSVATTAWDCARYLGANPIYMAALDLGFPGRQTHFRGAYFEEAFFATNSRLRPQETRSYTYLTEAEPFPVENNSGGLVLTDHRMAVYKFWFEAQMNLHPEIRTGNLSAGGLRIQGMPYANLEEILAGASVRALIEEKKQTLGRLFAAEAEEEKQQRVKTGLTALLGEMETLTEAAGDGVRAAHQAVDSLESGRNADAALRRLSGVDERVGRLPARDIAGFLAGGLIQEITAAGDPAADRRQWLDYSLKLYAELEKSGRFHIEHLSKSLARL